jgi:multiple sugar transport system substrate-binding protein
MGNRGTLSRRGFVAGTAAAGALALAGAARAQGVAIPEPIGTIPTDAPLRWIDSGDQKAVFYKAFLPAYGEARGIETVYDGLPWSELNTVLPLGLQNGTAQDAFCLPLNYPPAFAVRDGWVQPLDELIPDLAAWKANFPDGAFMEGLNVFDGKTYGLPYTSALVTSAMVLFNRKLLADAGLDPESPPQTWEAFRETARKITESSKGRAYGFIIGGAQVNRWADITRTLGQRAGAACGDQSLGAGIDFRTGKVVWDDDAFVGAVELLLALKSDGSVFPGTLGLNAPQARAMMPQGVSGMILQGPWNIPQWERENPDFDFGLAPPPAAYGQDGPVIVSQLAAASNTMFINARAGNAQAAADVFHYLGTPEGQIAWGGVVGPSDPPIFPAAQEQAEMSARSTAALAMFGEMMRVGPNAFARNPELAEVAKAYVEPTPNLGATVQGLFTGQMTGVKESLTALTQATEAALDKAFADASAAGAKVSRDDLVFPNWDPAKNYVAADYQAL